MQPLYADIDTGGFAVAHNGNLTNALTLPPRVDLFRRHLPLDVRHRSHPSPPVALEAAPRRRALRRCDPSDRRRLCPRLPDQRHADRRPRPHRYPSAGPRPLGDILRARVRDLRARHRRRPSSYARSRMARSSSSPRTASKVTGPFPKRPARPCIFEYIYFARPTASSAAAASTTSASRWAFSWRSSCPPRRDVIVPIPISACLRPSATRQASGVPFELGIIRNHYVGRTFIEPSQQHPRAGRQAEALGEPRRHRGKRIVLIDDSVVRGTTSKKIVQLMFEAGAQEVHMRISSPPITHPDYYGIDTPRKKDLLAATMSLEEMRQFMGATSSPSCPLTASTARRLRPPRLSRPAIHRPLLHRRIPDESHRSERRSIPRQLSLLAEVG